MIQPASPSVSAPSIPSQPVVIAGMHRSGTSLTASVLQQLGVHIGDQLLGPAATNAKGHFEDLDFLSFHQEILLAQGISTEGWTRLTQVEVPPQFIDRARHLRDSRVQQGGLWGWKDPRTTLFLNFWESLLDQACYIFVYREPWAVINSLFARGDAAFVHHPSLAIETWMAYNSALLQFYQHVPERCVLLHLSHLQGAASTFTTMLKQKLSLAVAPIQEPVFEGQLLHQPERLSHRVALLSQFYPEAIDLFKQLNTTADLPCDQSTLASLTADSYYREWALQDWLLVRRHESQTQALQTQLAEAEARSLDLQHQIEAFQGSKFWKMRNAWLKIKKRIKPIVSYNA